MRIKSSLTPPLPVASGVPQGSILGPLLFLIFINDLSNLSFSSSSKLFPFADDIFLFHPLSSREDLTSLQADLDSINNWLKLHLLTLNTSKSKYLIFSLNPQSSFDHLPPLLISGSTLEWFSYKHLGLTLTCILWTNHIKSIIKKANI